MKHGPAPPVVVGVDGSTGAVTAAKWAIDEAVSRNVRLRILHVIDVEPEPAAPYDAFRLDVQYAEAAVRGASAAVHATGKAVTTETDILWGPVDITLIKASANASMICLGSLGTGAIEERLLGSTATTVAENARCPVAVIRTQHRQPVADTRWIVTVIDDDPANVTVLRYAMYEARIRRAPVLVVGIGERELGETLREVDRRVDEWRCRFPDVHIHPVVTGADVARFLADFTDESAPLAVVGERDVDRFARVVEPHGCHLVPHRQWSVLIVR